jgi:hypothetical protein
MSCRVYHWTSGSIFGVVAALHVVRLLNEWPFQVGPWHLPVALSWAAVAAAAGLCLWAFRLSARA